MKLDQLDFFEWNYNNFHADYIVQNEIVIMEKLKIKKPMNNSLFGSINKLMLEINQDVMDMQKSLSTNCTILQTSVKKKGIKKIIQDTDLYLIKFEDDLFVRSKVILKSLGEKITSINMSIFQKLKNMTS